MREPPRARDRGACRFAQHVARRSSASAEAGEQCGSRLDRLAEPERRERDAEERRARERDLRARGAERLRRRHHERDARRRSRARPAASAAATLERRCVEAERTRRRARGWRAPAAAPFQKVVRGRGHAVEERRPVVVEAPSTRTPRRRARRRPGRSRLSPGRGGRAPTPTARRGAPSQPRAPRWSRKKSAPSSGRRGQLEVQPQRDRRRAREGEDRGAAARGRAGRRSLDRTEQASTRPRSTCAERERGARARAPAPRRAPRRDRSRPASWSGVSVVEQPLAGGRRRTEQCGRKEREG